MDGLLIQVYYPNEQEIKWVLLKKYNASVDELFIKDFIFSVCYNSTNLQISDIIGFMDSSNNVIENENLCKFVLSPEYGSIENNFIQVLCKTTNDKEIQTDKVESTNSNCQTDISSNDSIIFVKEKGLLKRCNAIMGNIMIVNSEDFKSYITNHRGLKYLQEYQETRTLKEKSRRAVIDLLGSYSEDNFGLYPSKNEKVAVCNACVELFPILKTNNIDLEGIDLLYNIKNGTGYYIAKIKNMRKLSKLDSSENNDPNKPVKAVIPEINIEKFRDDLTFMQNAIIPKQLDEIKSKLITTFAARQHIIKSKDNKINLKDEFPYFFVQPDLITFDFQQFSKENNFIKKWQRIEQDIIHVVKLSGKETIHTEENNSDEWNSATLAFINFINLLPPLPLGRKSTPRDTQLKAIDKLILFKSIGLTEKEYSGVPSDAPYLIAIGPKKSAISQYLISIDGHIVPLAKNVSIADAVEKLYEAHFVFNISYDPNLKSFWTYIQHYLFDMGGELSPSILNVYLKIEGYIKEKTEKEL